MREIKWDTYLFRVWDKNTNSMWNENISIVNGIDEMYCDDVENLIFLQYTGMIDKNNHYIYEGDIISWWNKGIEWRAKVIYSDSKGRFLALFNNGDKVSLNKNLEVLGNIYENDELLIND